MKSNYFIACAFFFSMFCGNILNVESSEFGKFSSEPEVRLVGNRSIITMKAFSFIDKHGREWMVPKNYKSNGASIPRFFWSLVGGPLSGGYRDGSILHDYFCERKTIESDIVHKVFHDAMLARGVSKNKAHVMYKAVKWFGPNWSRKTNDVPVECVPGKYFKPTVCVLNSDIETQDTTIAFSGPSLLQFLSSLEAEGYRAEAKEIRRKATYSKILQ